MAEEIIEELRREGHGIGRPCALQTAGDRIRAFARAATIDPSQALMFDAFAGRGRADAFGGRSGAMRLPESVAAGDEGDGFFVVHGHAPEGFANVLRRS